MDITRFIPHGKENRISSKDLATITCLDSRTVKQLIANARKNGAVICSCLDGNRGGYFFPECDAEVTEYVRTEQRRIASAKAALQSAKDYLSDTK